MTFILVPVSQGGRITDIHRNALPGLSFAAFQRTYNELYGSLRASGGCEAVMSVIIPGPNAVPTLRHARNTPMGNHAEENILTEYHQADVPITSALINLEPCYNHRYGNGHNCFEFFTAAGRNFHGVTRRFVPHTQPYTPIFFLESQPPPGQRSTVSRSLGRLSRSDAMAAVANRGGAAWAFPVTRAGRGHQLTTIQGQEFMRETDIVAALRTWRVPLNDWDSEGCDLQTRNEVRRLWAIR